MNELVRFHDTIWKARTVSESFLPDLGSQDTSIIPYEARIAIACLKFSESEFWWARIEFFVINFPREVSRHYLQSSDGFRKFPPGFRVSRYINNPLWSPICDSMPQVFGIWILVSKDFDQIRFEQEKKRVQMGSVPSPVHQNVSRLSKPNPCRCLETSPTSLGPQSVILTSSA